MSDERSTISIRICQEGHANALALNKDCTQIAVAGRSLLKVFSIEQDGFTEVCNMRGGKNQNLSYSSNDVAWSPLDNNILATAATNGVVSVWDLSRFGRHKQLITYNEHERTAHTVTFHSSEPYLLSGSQDGTIKRFDIKNEKFVTTYFSNSESVRDVKFNPCQPNVFAAVSENGTVQLWDIRRPDKCTLQFTAHSGPIYTCDWHATQPWLATGSRDKQIKVWNMGLKPSLEYTINTIAVVGRVKWRPDNIYHIASCSLVVDYSIHIWDVRRPFIQFASFNEHSNVTTGIAWKGDPNVLLSTSKDSTIYKHVFKDAIRPSNRVNPQGTSINMKGEVLYAYEVKPVTTNASSNRPPKPKLSVSSDNFHLAKSNLQNVRPMRNGFEISTTSKEMDRTNRFREFENFQGCANEYFLTGNTLPELCEHNAEVAKKYGKHDVSLLWNFVKLSYTASKRSNSNTESRSVGSNQNLLNNLMLAQQTTNHQIITNFFDDTNGNIEDEALMNGNAIDETKQLDFKHPKSGEFKHPGSGYCNAFPSPQPIANFGTEPYGDCVFGDAELTVNNMDCIKSLRNGFLYTGPHDLCKGWSIPHDSTIMGHDLQPSRPHELTPDHTQDLAPPIASDSVCTLKIPNIPSIPQWEPHQVLQESLFLQAQVGDVQTTVSILIVLGERRVDLSIDIYVYEMWLMSYIDQLHRLQMWNKATEIMKSSWIRSVSDINEQSTAVHTNCGDCGKSLNGKAGWFCLNCKSANSSKCSVCHLVVRGLYAWCQGCSHGGHLEHMKQWFLNHSKCPICGHLCEYE